jgi:peptidoglycan/xylan/chitin deacetylase (PgdA/CDA1 family)
VLDSAAKKFNRGVEKVRRYLSSRALILLYHRISEPESDPWQLAVSPGHLEEHLQVLSKHGRLTPLRKLSASVENGMLSRRSIAVTFDDGYADNLLNAKPLLEKHDVPATVFIATGYTGEGREFWWDQLDALFLQPGELPRNLDLLIDGNKRHWELGASASYDENAHRRNRQWKGWQTNEPSLRHSVYRSLWELMHRMRERDRRRVSDDLLTWAGASGSPRATHRTLARDEIIELARRGLIDVGCHTVTHPQLSSLDIDSQRDEICRSKRELEEVLSHRVTGFAYPYGRECDYTSETVSLVRDCGFDYACTTSVGVVDQKAGRFQLPRVQVQDMDGDDFARLISQWLDD